MPKAIFKRSAQLVQPHILDLWLTLSAVLPEITSSMMNIPSDLQHKHRPWHCKMISCVLESSTFGSVGSGLGQGAIKDNSIHIAASARLKSTLGRKCQEWCFRHMHSVFAKIAKGKQRGSNRHTAV